MAIRILKRAGLLIPLCLIYSGVMLYLWGWPDLGQLSTSKVRHLPQKLEKQMMDTAVSEDANATKTKDVDIVVGIPSIKRPGRTVYLDKTLESVVRKRHQFDNVIFVVFLAELDKEWRQKMAKLVKSKFADEVDQGFIQVIYPPDDLYPDWSKMMKITLGDPPHQVQWRSKQNLDQAYLMEYASSLQPKYYLGIEDDVTATDNYLATIFQHAESIQRDDILFISYCEWGSIGKLFQSKMLPTVSRYLKNFWNYKPLDWLYFDLKRTLACRYPLTNCEKEANSIVVEYGTNLFTHDGKVSSLDKTGS